YVSAETLNALAALNRAKAQEMAQDQVDAANVAATGWKDSLVDAMDVLAQHAKDTAAQVAQLFEQTIDETNRNLVDMMSGDYKKGDWKKEGHDLFKTISGDALKQAEAPLVQAASGGLKKLFGIDIAGKPDGSSNNPFHVVLGGGGQNSSGPGGLMSIVRGIFNKGAQDDSGGGSQDDSGDSGGSGGIRG